MPKSNREFWVEELRREQLLDDEHIYSKRYLGICENIVNQCAKDPAYEPPSYEDVMKDAPWGP